jgi:hypothetical protein
MFFNGTVGDAHVTEQLSAAAFKKGKVVGVVDNIKRVTVGINDAVFSEEWFHRVYAFKKGAGFRGTIP